MRILLRNDDTQKLAAYEISGVYINKKLTVYDDTCKLEEVSDYTFPAVVHFIAAYDEALDICIVTNEETASALVRSISKNGFLDAVTYSPSTFVNPSVDDNRRLTTLEIMYRSLLNK
jgi:hypothetical protein